MENKKFKLKFKNQNNQNNLDGKTNGPYYLDYDEDNDQIVKQEIVKHNNLDDDSFTLDELLLEDNNEDYNDYTNSNNANVEQHENKAKKIIIAAFAIILLIIILVASILIFNKKGQNIDNNKDNNSLNNTIDTSEPTNNASTSTDMYGDGYFKVYNKNVKYYSAVDTMNVLQNANETIKQYFSIIKDIEAANLNTVERKNKIDDLETMLSKDYDTLEVINKVFDKYGESGINLYNSIFARFENIEGLLAGIKFLNSGQDSVEKINNSIDIENQELQNMSKLIIEFANDNKLTYKESDDIIKIDE